VRRALRERGRRARLHRVHLQLPGRRPHAPAGRARQRLRARAGVARRALDLRDRRESDHGRAQPRPRPAPTDILMSQLHPTIRPLDLSLEAPPRATRRRFHLPGWVSLLLSNTKSRLGLLMVGTVVVVAIIAPWISVSDPNAFNLLATRQAPSWHHLFGT